MLRLKKGFSTTFFLFFLVNYNYAQVLSYDFIAASNKGILTNDYWQNNSIESIPKKVIAFKDSKINFKLLIDNHPFFLKIVISKLLSDLQML